MVGLIRSVATRTAKAKPSSTLVISYLHKRQAGDPGLKERPLNGHASVGLENLGAGFGLEQRYVPRFLDR